MSLIKPILDDQGQFLGIVGLDLSLEHLQAEAAKYKPLGGYVTLITSKASMLPTLMMRRCGQAVRRSSPEYCDLEECY